MKNRAILLSAMMLLMTAAANAQLSPAAALIGREAAKSVISKAGQEARDAINVGGEVGNGLVTHAASELSVLAQNAQLMLSGSEDKLVRDLSIPQANLLGKITEATQQLASAQMRAYYIRNVSVVDIASMTAALPFTNVPYFVQSVGGLSQVKGPTDYFFKVVARGIEIASSDSSSALTVALNDKPVDARINVTQREVAEITISNSTLAPFFKFASQPTAVKATFEITVITQPKKRRFSSSNPITTKISAPVWLTLYPEHAGDITVTAYSPIYTWVRLDAAHEAKSISTPVLTTQSFTLPVSGGASSKTPGAQRIVGGSFSCDQTFSGNPAFCGSGAYWSLEVPPTVTEDGKRLSGTIKNWGEKLWFTLHAVVDELRVDPTQAKEVIAYPLTWDTPLKITLPAGWTSYRIDGTTITKREVHLNENRSAGEFLKFEQQMPAPPGELRPAVNYRVGLPE